MNIINNNMINVGENDCFIIEITLKYIVLNLLLVMRDIFKQFLR